MANERGAAEPDDVARLLRDAHAYILSLPPLERHIAARAADGVPYWRIAQEARVSDAAVAHIIDSVIAAISGRDVEPVESGSMRVPEPPEDSPLVDPAEVDLVIVPALVLDERGARIGYGAGYYDHLLPRLTRAVRIGVVFDFQLVAEVPETVGDERVNVVVTDERVIEVLRNP